MLKATNRPTFKTDTTYPRPSSTTFGRGRVRECRAACRISVCISASPGPSKLANTLCVHMHAGPHRTGAVAPPLEVATWISVETGLAEDATRTHTTETT